MGSSKSTVFVETKELTRAVGIAGGAVNARTANMKPILGSLLAKAEGGVLALTGCDLESFVRVECPCDSPSPFLALLPAARLSAWLGLARGETCEIGETDCGISFTCGRHKATVQTEKSADFPPFNPDLKSPIELTCGQLRAALRVRYACDLNSSKWAIGGVCISIRDKKMFAASTDGRQSAVQEMGDTDRPDGMWIVPDRAAAIISRSLPDTAAEPCQIGFTGNCATVVCGGVSIEVRLLEGRFPPYWGLEEKAVGDASLNVPLKPFLDACRLALTAASLEDKAGLKYGDFTAGDGELTVAASGEAESSASIPVAYSGPTVTAHIGIALVADFLNHCNGVDDVQFSIRGDAGVAKVESRGGFYTYIQQASRP